MLETRVVDALAALTPLVQHCTSFRLLSRRLLERLSRTHAALRSAAAAPSSSSSASSSAMHTLLGVLERVRRFVDERNHENSAAASVCACSRAAEDARSLDRELDSLLAASSSSSSAAAAAAAAAAATESASTVSSEQLVSRSFDSVLLDDLRALRDEVLQAQQRGDFTAAQIDEMRAALRSAGGVCASELAPAVDKLSGAVRTATHELLDVERQTALLREHAELRARLEEAESGLGMLRSQPIDSNALCVILVGDACVGKSMLLRRLVRHDFDTDYVPTVGTDIGSCSLSIGETTVRVRLWDLAGQERFRVIVGNYYRGAHSVLLVFDLGNRASFDHVTSWFDEWQTHGNPDYVSNGILVGTKADVVDHRAVTYTEAAAKAAKHGFLYLETSARTGTGVDTAFEWLVGLVASHTPQVLLPVQLSARSAGQGDKARLVGSEDDDAAERRAQAGCCGGLGGRKGRR